MDRRAVLIGEAFSPVGERRKWGGENSLPILPVWAETLKHHTFSSSIVHCLVLK